MTDNAGPSIRVTKNGPYLVEGGVPITREEIVVDETGESVAWREVESFSRRGSCALCRCGSSEAKPYCDGSHMSVGFHGDETASNTAYAEASVAIEGPRIVLRDQIGLCAEARFCSAKGTAWKRAKADDEESRDIVVQEAHLCPSGRYTACDPESGEAIEPDLAQSIAVVEDPSQGISGPLWARGRVPVYAADGTAYEVRNRVTLCRCGESKNKPFCDSTHVDIGFNDAD
jgi:CDGSH-type Zn-finger protein